VALVVVASDKGSPGVTTTAVTLAAVWPRRALLAELDPSGGDVALRLRGPRGAPLSPEVGLISLAVGVRRGSRPEQVFEHVQRLDGGLEVVVGLSTGEQGSGLVGLWGPVGELLDQAPGVDVIADCGRLYPGSPAVDVLASAAAVVLVTRPTIDAVAHLRARATAVLRELDRRPGRPALLSVVVVTGPRDDTSPKQIEQVLRQAGLPVPVLGRIALDPKGAGLLSGEWVGRLDKSLLVRSTREVAGQLAQRLAAPVGR
jgi:MinD-like ATPase involved in chromosome partitioning or flagellar assembly